MSRLIYFAPFGYFWMSKISNFLNNLDQYQEVGAKALGVEHRFAIGGISMMQAVLGVVTLGIGILIGVVVYNSISTALPAPTPGSTLSTLFNSTTTQFSSALSFGVIFIISLCLKRVNDRARGARSQYGCACVEGN